MTPNGSTPAASVSDALPDWLKEKKRPPWIQASVWNRLPKQDKEDVYADETQALEDWLATRPARLEWTPAALGETIGLFFSGLKADGQVAEHAILSPDFGLGVAGEWQEHAAANANAAQYLNLFRILGGGFPPAHFNLCGQLTVMALLGVSLPQGLQTFRNTPSGADILANRSMGTLGGQLARFIHALTNNGLAAEFKRAANSNRPEPVLTPAQMVEHFNQGGLLLALVNIDGFRNIGNIKPVADSRRTIAHWVAAIDVIEPRRGETIIRTYNPFHNQEELYTWPTFSASWKETEGNFSKYGVVVALPA